MQPELTVWEARRILITVLSMLCVGEVTLIITVPTVGTIAIVTGLLAGIFTGMKGESKCKKASVIILYIITGVVAIFSVVFFTVGLSLNQELGNSQNPFDVLQNYLLYSMFISIISQSLIAICIGYVSMLVHYSRHVYQPIPSSNTTV